MGISVNGVEITDAAVEKELPHHDGAANPLQAAVHELILRQLLLQKADELGLDDADEDARIDAVIAREVAVPEADTEACRRYYDGHPEKFVEGELVEAQHILFQVTEKVPLDLLRELAESVLAEVKAAPERFDELARQYSNCASAEVGGHLGQLQRGETVPEFERVLFRLEGGEIASKLVETRFGLHIVRVLRHIPGQRQAFEHVAEQIGEYLVDASQSRALNQYLQLLAGQAKIEGIELPAADSPLVQ
ncbi:peptidylprolyl isomerase [Chitinivorax sp. PXF-14]|uniref:peptidylprolyl isomerase n=1 Tax=Chitinivorax sp. PXF-14 TaxID=3230488 RepID=UPI003466F5DB